MTVESIIIAFLFAYIPLVSPTLVYWIQQKGPLSPQIVTTVWAGLAVNTLILIGFRSILLLFESIEKDDTRNQRFAAGLDLFFIVILGSALYVIASMVSILHYAQTGNSFTSNILPVNYLLYAPLLIFVPILLVVWFRPLPLSRWLRRRKSMNRVIQTLKGE